MSYDAAKQYSVNAAIVAAFKTAVKTYVTTKFRSIDAAFY
jgi:hypothetical protein